MARRAHQTELFTRDLAWEQEWGGMPEFVQGRQEEYAKVVVRFRTRADFDDFCQRIGQRLTPVSKSTWHPALPTNGSSQTVQRYVDGEDT
jgi:hypothetical protein